MKSKKVIWPLGIGYLLCLLVGTFFTLFAGWFLLFNSLLGNQVLDFLNKVVEAIFWLISGNVLFYLIVFRIALNDRIIFDEKTIASYKRKMGFSDTLPAQKTICAEIVNAEIEEKFYRYLVLKLASGKRHKIFATPFSRKQIDRMLQMIKERGGLATKP